MNLILTNYLQGSITVYCVTYLGAIKTADERCVTEINSKLGLAKAASQKI